MFGKHFFREHNIVKEFELTPPETKKSIRLIPISNTLIEVLQDLLLQQSELKQSSALDLDENFVFIKMNVNQCGYPESLRLIGAHLKDYLRLASISKDITLQKLRYTHFSLLAEASFDLLTIQKRFGHENANTTLKIYLHVPFQPKSRCSQ